MCLFRNSNFRHLLKNLSAGGRPLSLRDIPLCQRGTGSNRIDLYVEKNTLQHVEDAGKNDQQKGYDEGDDADVERFA